MRRCRPAMEAGIVRGATGTDRPRRDAGSANLAANGVLKGIVVIGALTFLDCDAPPRGSEVRNDLGKMQTAALTVTDRQGRAHRFDVWLATTPAEHALGLMNVADGELGPDRGMLFVFDRDQPRSFWMRNTIIPLDLAYIRSDGTIVRIVTMQPLDESLYPSIEPARLALEVRAGELARRGIVPGDRVEFPAALLNPQP